MSANSDIYFKKLSEIKAHVKQLPHNELSRQYAVLFAQHMLLQQTYDNMLQVRLQNLITKINHVVKRLIGRK